MDTINDEVPGWVWLDHAGGGLAAVHRRFREPRRACRI